LNFRVKIIVISKRGAGLQSLSPFLTQSISHNVILHDENLIDCALFSKNHDVPEWHFDGFTVYEFGYLADVLGIRTSEACCECGGGRKIGDPLTSAPFCDDNLWNDVTTDLECSSFETVYGRNYIY